MLAAEPDVAPQVTSRPPRARLLTLLSHVAWPTCSTTTSTPRRARQLSDFLRDVLGVVVDDLVGSERTGTGQLLIGARRREYLGSMQPGDLHRGLTDAAAGREHEHGLARAETGPRDQHVPRREERQRKGRRLTEPDRVRNRNEIPGRYFHQLGVAAFRPISEDVVAGTEIVRAREALRALAAAQPRLQHHPQSARDVSALGSHHLTGDIATRTVRQPKARQASALPQIEVIEGAGADAHQHLARSDLGVWHLLVAKDVESSMLVKSNGFHGGGVSAPVRVPELRWVYRGQGGRVPA